MVNKENRMLISNALPTKIHSFDTYQSAVRYANIIIPFCAFFSKEQIQYKKGKNQKKVFRKQSLFLVIYPI